MNSETHWGDEERVVLEGEKFISVSFCWSREKSLTRTQAQTWFFRRQVLV